MMIEAEKYGATKNVAMIAAFLSVRNVYTRPRGKEVEADAAHLEYHDERSDALTFINIWNAYERNSCSRSWCFSKFLNAKALEEIGKIAYQYLDILEREGIAIEEAEDDDAILKAVAAGLVYNLLYLDGRAVYHGIFRQANDVIRIHPSSSLFHEIPQWMVSAEVVRTTKTFARVCSEVRSEWLPEIAPHIARVEERISFWKPGDKTAFVERKLFVAGREMGYVGEREVTIDEAARIQDETILRAEKRGLIRLAVRKDRLSRFSEAFYAESGRTRYRVSIYDSGSVSDGTVYYCRPDPLPFMYGEILAFPEFRVFNFPVAKPNKEVKPEPKPDTKCADPAAKEPVQASSVAGLAAKWGAKVSKRK